MKCFVVSRPPHTLQYAHSSCQGVHSIIGDRRVHYVDIRTVREYCNDRDAINALLTIKLSQTVLKQTLGVVCTKSVQPTLLCIIMLASPGYTFDESIAHGVNNKASGLACIYFQKSPNFIFLFINF